jgi:hypothetical protein
MSHRAHASTLRARDRTRPSQIAVRNCAELAAANRKSQDERRVA